MTETTAIAENFFDDLDNEIVDEGSITSERVMDNKTLDARRRLEETLERRYLERDVREFDFDI